MPRRGPRAGQVADRMADDQDLEELYAELLQRGGGTPTGAMLQSDINRGVLPGARSPGAEEMTPEDLALLDRFAWGRQAGLGGIPVAAGYEALKAVSQAPGMGSVLPVVAGAMGFEHTGGQFEQDETSSPASWGNIGAYIRGAMPRIPAGSAAEALTRSSVGSIRR